MVVLFFSIVMGVSVVVGFVRAVCVSCILVVLSGIVCCVSSVVVGINLCAVVVSDGRVPIVMLMCIRSKLRFSVHGSVLLMVELVVIGRLVVGPFWVSVVGFVMVFSVWLLLVVPSWVFFVFFLLVQIFFKCWEVNPPLFFLFYHVYRLLFFSCTF